MNTLFILVLSGQVQNSLIYNDLPIGYTLKWRTMSSLRKDSRQHRSITAPLRKNQTEANFICEIQQVQSESYFCDVTLVCDDVDIGTHKCMISSCFG